MNPVKSIIATAATFVALAGYGGVANAFMVTKLSDAPASWGAAMLATPNTLNTPGTWTAAPSDRVGNLVNEYRSTFDNQDVIGDNTPYKNNHYWAVGPGNPNNPAIMTFTSDQATLSFLWGSVDYYNVLKLYDNGSLVATIMNTDITPSPTNAAGRGASYVTVSGVVFDRIEFSADINAFEFSNMSTTPVPLPAAAWLLLSGLAGLGVVGRRKKS